jgi:hypothetical protein
MAASAEPGGSARSGACGLGPTRSGRRDAGLRRALLALAAVLAVPACERSQPAPDAGAAVARAPAASASPADPHEICRDIRNSYECAQAVEAQQLARSGGLVGRSGDTLVFTLRDGSTARVTNPAVDSEADAVHYTYWTYLQPVSAFVVHVQYYEGSEFLLVHDVSGIQEYLPGEPILSPARDRFAAASVDLVAGYARNLLQIWRVDEDSFEREWQIEGHDWGPAAVEWVDDETLNVTILRVCANDPAGCTEHAVLRRDDRSWTLEPVQQDTT